MTFTALIAAVSHMFIEPNIILEHYDALLICIVVAAVASLVSAQFANKVKNRTVGLVTGAVLFLLGATMIVLNYWDFIVQCELIVDMFLCFCKFVGFILTCAVILLILRKVIKIAKPVFRKLLHLVACFSSVFMVLVADSWLAATLDCLFFAALVFPALAILEKCAWYEGLFVQKKKGEVKVSLLLLFVGIAAVIALGWGLFGERYLAIASILMWGMGDAMAALVGIYLGKHKIKSKISDGKKTYEGSFAAFLSAFCFGLLVLFLMSDIAWYWCLLICLPTAMVTSFIELISRDGVDTITVPLFTVFTLSLLTLLVV